MVVSKRLREGWELLGDLEVLDLYDETDGKRRMGRVRSEMHEKLRGVGTSVETLNFPNR